MEAYDTITIRTEQPEDYRPVKGLPREALWNVYHQGCNEHYLVHILRNVEVCLPTLDLVAITEG